RMENIDALADIVAIETRKERSEAICVRLAAEGVPAAPIRMQSRVHEDPQVIANGLLLEREHAKCGPIRVPGPVARFGATPSEVRRLAPVLGEHTDEVLIEIGVTPAELANLRAQSALA
ncbi:MAG TPA: CoA transferase, partial [Myxococcota bacterium]|nr:CoA transferase [Myxococcota bacterium]